MIEEDEVGLKEKPEDTSKRLHQNKTEAPEVRSKDLIPNVAIIGNCGLGESTGASHLKAPSGGGGGGVKSQPCGVYNWVFNSVFKAF